MEWYEDDFKYHLVMWKQVCSSISSSDLDIRNLKVFNRALLGKWLWRYNLEPKSLWKLVIDSRYDVEWQVGHMAWDFGSTFSMSG